MKKWILIFLSTLMFCGTFVAWQRGWLEKPEPPREIRVEQTDFYCAQMAGYDDGANDTERLAMAIATLNLARSTNSSPCDVYRSFRSLIAPGSTTLFPWFREPANMYVISRLTADKKSDFDRTGIALERFLKNPTDDLKKYPWLQCVTHYMRSAWPWATPRPDPSLREKMKTVWKSPVLVNDKQAEFFCPN